MSGARRPRRRREGGAGARGRATGPARATRARPRRTAEERLEWILEILPLAARGEGVTVDELADRFDTTPEHVVALLTEMLGREDYHPPGGTDDIALVVDEDGRVRAHNKFARPVRLGPVEALALSVGLRALAFERAESAREALLALAEELERGLAAFPLAEVAKLVFAGDAEPGAGARALLVEAARDRRCCRIRYCKPGKAIPEDRPVRPYAVVYSASGSWYLIAHCDAREGIRIFRVDRILEVVPLEDRFERPADFDPEAYVTDGGRVFRADETVTARVRYAPGIARWIREHGPVESEGADGSVVVAYEVADPGWLVRHVLQYGADAEVLEPPELRAGVAAAAGAVLEGLEAA